MDFQFGDVVNIEGRTGKYVFVGNKTPWSPDKCCYNDDFAFIPLEKAKEMEYYKDNDPNIMIVRVTGIQMTPKISKDETEAPFNIEKEVRFNIRQKQPKTVTVYE